MLEPPAPAAGHLTHLVRLFRHCSWQMDARGLG